MNPRVLAGAVAVCCGLAGLQAQQSAIQRPVFRTGTTLVQLDVVVTDPSGKPVPGLTKDDFKVFDGGRERPVVAMNEYHHEAPPPGSVRQDVASSATERLVAIVLDDHGKTGAALDRAKGLARDLVTALAGRAHLALIRTSREPGVEFTANAQALLDALALAPTIEEPIDPGPRVWGSIYGRSGPQGVQRVDPSLSPGRAAPSRGVSPIPDTLYNAFADGLLSANDGRRKSFIVITEGALYTRLAEDPVLVNAEIKKLDEGKLDDLKLVNDLHERLQKVFTAAIRTNSAVTIVDPRIGARGRSLSENGSARLIRATLDALARVSGGYAAIRDESVDGALSRTLADLDDYYVLGFEPIDPNGNKQHPVDVRVNRPGLTARTRTVFQLDEKAQRAVLAAAKKDPLLGLAYSPIPAGDLPLRLWATVLPPPATSAPASIALWIDSGGARLTEYAVFSIDMVNRREAAQPVGRKLTGVPPSLMRLDSPVLPPGRYQLRVGAQTDTADGSVYQTVVVPDFAKTPLAVTGLVIGTETLRRADAAPLPFTPTLERVFDTRARVRVGFRVWQIKTAEEVRTSIEVVDAMGRTVDGVNLVLAPSDSRIVSTDVTLPAAPGPYTIRVSAFASSQAVSDEISVRVR